MNFKNKNSGFTLIEILVAVAIIGIVLATVIGTFTGIIESSREAELKADLQQTGRAVINLIAADIRGLYKINSKEGNSLFHGGAEYLSSSSFSRLGFVTSNTLYMGKKKNPFLSEISYRVEKNEDDDLFSLLRRAQSPPEDPFDEGGIEAPVCRILESFDLKFINQGEEKDELTDELPDAVSIRFTINLNGEKDEFMTMVRPMISTTGVIGETG